MTEHEVHAPVARRKRRLGRTLALLVVLALFFGAGLAIGRGNLRINGLSLAPESKSQSSLDYSSVNQVYVLLKSKFDGKLDQTKLTDGLKTGLVNAAGDPYTEYFNTSAAKELNQELSGSFTGIGAELGKDSASHIIVVSPLSGYPAEKAGLKPKDIIAAINGESTASSSIEATVRKIRGPANTSVTLTIVRGDGSPFELKITRTEIHVPSVTSSVDGSIGYLKVSQFTSNTVDLAKQAASQFKSKGVKAIVLDLRGDPGGYLSGAVGISSLWLDPGQTVVAEKHGNRVINTDYASGSNPFKGLPTIVLIDSGSASASEITAGALHDNHVATLLGEKSFGKGSVQQIEDLGSGSELKVTIAHWYTPGGKNIDKQGITPDEVVSMSDSDKSAGKDPQKDRAYAILRAKIGQ